MSTALPWWVYVLAWLFPLGVTVVALACQLAETPRPELARKLFALAGVLAVIAAEVALIGLADILDLTLLPASLVQLLALSVAANVWLALRVRRVQRLYGEEEERGWAMDGLSYSTAELPPNRADRAHGVQVRVSSHGRIESPIRLRFWLSSQPRGTPRVWFHKNASRFTSKEIEEAEASGASSVTVGERGRVDVEWASGDALTEEGQLVFVAYASEPGVPISLLSVERRYRPA